ncbi:MAG: hypothetical protein HXK63_08310 [Campylobacter sp.]|nr:hypothetical protein [Campylobacter sp.]
MFLPLKFVVADISVHATLNFDFNGHRHQVYFVKIKILPCLRALNL